MKSLVILKLTAGLGLFSLAIYFYAGETRATGSTQLPVPFFSSELATGRHIAFLPEPSNYFEQKLALQGWKVIDQLGSSFRLSNGKTNIQVITRHVFTRFISELWIIELPPIGGPHQWRLKMGHRICFKAKFQHVF